LGQVFSFLSCQSYFRQFLVCKDKLKELIYEAFAFF